MRPIGIRLEQRDLVRVDRLANTSGFRRGALIRTLMRLGLARVEADPGALVTGDVEGATS